MRPKPSPVRARRLALGLSGYRVAKTAGTTPTNLAAIEAGAEPRVSLALRLADALGVDVRTLFPSEKKKRAA